MMVCKAVLLRAGGKVWVDTAVSTAVVLVFTGSPPVPTGSAGAVPTGWVPVGTGAA